MLSLSSDFERKTFALLVRKYGHNCQKCILPLKKNGLSNLFGTKTHLKTVSDFKQNLRNFGRKVSASLSKLHFL